MNPGPRRIVVATGNRAKLREIRGILSRAAAAARFEPELIGLEAFPATVLPPEGSDYEANAAGKARSAARQLGVICIGDDSGLEVDALGGAPGPLSARYGGEGLDDAGRVRHLLGALEGIPAAKRRARFVCVATLATPEGDLLCARGECAGQIAMAPRGSGGFGYDPVFRPESHTRVMAELGSEEKDRISHRGRALRLLRQRWLEAGVS